MHWLFRYPLMLDYSCSLILSILTQLCERYNLSKAITFSELDAKLKLQNHNKMCLF